MQENGRLHEHCSLRLYDVYEGYYVERGYVLISSCPSETKRSTLGLDIGKLHTIHEGRLIERIQVNSGRVPTVTHAISIRRGF